MKKIAFIVQYDFLSNHFGVRNFFSTIKRTLSEFCTTEYLVHVCTPETVLWYKVDVEEIISKQEDICFEYDESNSNKKINYYSFENFVKKHHINDFVNRRQYYRYVGNSLKNEHYDIAVITNPWTIDCNFEIHADRTIGIVHDITANLYALTKLTLDFSWANMHHSGYLYYNERCNDVLANSLKTAEEYKEYYKEITGQVNYLKPFVPYEFKNVSYVKEKKENAMLLAAPFDPRKGLAQMPALINGIKDHIDTLYIFGMPRCETVMFNKFFNDLKIKHIKYYPHISTEGLIDLYKKCKVLFFPSLEEGLGFPILEAQVCGCRVITTNKEPMNKMILEGCYLLSGNYKIDVQQIIKMFEDEKFDYTSLSSTACREFSHEDIINFFNKTGRFAEN